MIVADWNAELWDIYTYIFVYVCWFSCALSLCRPVIAWCVCMVCFWRVLEKQVQSRLRWALPAFIALSNRSWGSPQFSIMPSQVNITAGQGNHSPASAWNDTLTLNIDASYCLTVVPCAGPMYSGNLESPFVILVSGCQCSVLNQLLKCPIIAPLRQRRWGHLTICISVKNNFIVHTTQPLRQPPAKVSWIQIKDVFAIQCRHCKPCLF